MDKEQLAKIQKFMQEDLLTKSEAAAITDQSPIAFNQSVNLGYIKPFYESKGEKSSKVRLYLRSDIEEYARTKKNINKKRS